MAWDVFARLFSAVRLQRTPDGRRRERLELCPLCGRDFVNLVDWEPVDADRWWMLLRCGECEALRELTVTNAVALRYDTELDRRARALTALLERLDRERMIGEAEAMTTALRLGLVDASDFATKRSHGSTPSG